MKRHVNVVLWQSCNFWSSRSRRYTEYIYIKLIYREVYSHKFGPIIEFDEMGKICKMTYHICDRYGRDLSILFINVVRSMCAIALSNLSGRGDPDKAWYWVTFWNDNRSL